MDVDIRGRVDNIRLSTSRPLLPVFEAVVNAIHSVEESKGRHGRIEVRLIRDLSQGVLKPEQKGLLPIHSFEIVDNGVGFTDGNFNSFITSDTRRKANQGGKGVGRLLWLKAFDKASITSLYEEKGKYWRRAFDFVCSRDGIAEHEVGEVEGRVFQTTERGTRSHQHPTCNSQGSA